MGTFYCPRVYNEQTNSETKKEEGEGLFEVVILPWSSKIV